MWLLEEDMATYTAIANVGETLVELLEAEMTGPNNLLGDGHIELISPVEVGEKVKARLTLYLYDVTENADLRNQPDRRESPTTTQPAPLALDLRYLLTAHPGSKGNDPTGWSADQHAVLGRAMQVLSQHSMLSEVTHIGSLSSEEPMQLSVLPDGMDEVMRIWGTFDGVAYQPSIAYLVTPVLIETGDVETVQPIVEKEERYDVY